MFRGAGDRAGKCILNLFMAFNFRERKSIVKRITIIKNKGSGDNSGGAKVKCMTDTTKVANAKSIDLLN